VVVKQRSKRQRSTRSILNQSSHVKNINKVSNHVGLNVIVATSNTIKGHIISHKEKTVVFVLIKTTITIKSEQVIQSYVYTNVAADTLDSLFTYIALNIKNQSS
jgi:hypothetical protein